jgi:glycosyltransferase involved in cell wall biosynthesis
MKAQTVKPTWWVIVDDGSEDDTASIADAAAANESWITVVRRGDRGFRLSGKGVVDAFNDGFRTVQEKGWEFVSKFDGDLSFDPDYFERCLAEFAADPGLGMGGGLCCVQRGAERVAEFAGDPPFHVRGPTKIYRRACWEAIGGLLNVPGWDGIDELKANMLGWRTRTFQHIRLIHHRPTGNADGLWKNQSKFGRANYIMGYHPLFMAAKIFKRVLQKPYLVGAMGLCWGYVSAGLRALDRVQDRDLVRYVRSEQLKTLMGQKSIWRPGQ